MRTGCCRVGAWPLEVGLQLGLPNRLVDRLSESTTAYNSLLIVRLS